MEQGGNGLFYHGYYARGGGVIAIEDAEGQQTGVVEHIACHSPTGIGWGRTSGASGMADCARSLLVAALGPEASKCPSCNGTKKVVFIMDRDEDVPFDPEKADEYDPELVGGCICTNGLRQLPYHVFQWEVIAKLDEDWRMSQQEILDWLSGHENPPGPPVRM